LVVSSPPYCLGKRYEKAKTVDEFLEFHRAVLPELVRVTKPGGSICWQVGSHVDRRNVYPLDYAVFSIMEKIENIYLRNRVIWSFGHGIHEKRRFSGRHETVLWFTKGNDYLFNLDDVRVAQKYPGKKYYRGPKKGQWSGNPLGKNPGDFWYIPNVNATHVEKTQHPCQFPVALAERLVRALTEPGDLVFDPFMGSGSSGVAALSGDRRFLGADLFADYIDIAEARLRATLGGNHLVRPIDQPVYEAKASAGVAQVPVHFIRSIG
jgi:adenine-specific DNA-methyltransferase